MSHLTTPANTKTDAGAPGLTGTSPGQAIGTDEIQDQSNTKQELKHYHNNTEKSAKSGQSESHNNTGNSVRTEQSESRSESTTKERNSESQSKGSLDVVTEPPVRASTPTPAGAPGATGTSPNQPFGGDESRDDSLNGHSIKQGSHASEKDGSSHSKSSTDSRPSDAHKSESNTSTSGGSEKDPGVTASTKTPAGAGGPTGTAPMEAIGDDASRDTSHKTHEHHKHHSHHSAENTSSQKGSEKSSITPKEKSAPSVNSTEDSINNVLKKSEFDGPNASFSSDIGSKEDPGRVAEQEMFEKNAQRGDVGSMGVKQDSITGGGQFDVLESEEAA